MSENMTDWQKIAAIYRNLETMNDISGQAVDLAIGTKLAEMIKQDSDVIVETTGVAEEKGDIYDYRLKIMKHLGNHYFVIFPDTETADATGRKYITCKLKELFNLIQRTPQMRGAMLVIEASREKENFSLGEITSNMIAIATSVIKNP